MDDQTVVDSKPDSSRKSQAVTIVLDEDVAQALVKKAKSLGISPNQLIRKVLYDKLFIEPHNLLAKIAIIFGGVSAIGTEFFIDDHSVFPFLLDCFLAIIGLIFSIISIRSRLSFRPVLGIILSVIGLLKLIYFIITILFYLRFST